VCNRIALQRNAGYSKAGMWGIVNLRFRVFTLLLSMSAIAVGGCASVYNLPANRPLLSPVPVYDVGRMDPSFDDDVLLMLSFSWWHSGCRIFFRRIAGARSRPFGVQVCEIAA